ncbi:hypothetical protein [Seinonella peptonophila]|uniref:hypothetical protein n=1 Tax=Seinonella peptonophila TaxID=112248 RepID=UPI0009345A88|nr:hypothetical protein [Seinonella peptonophila]
MDLRTKIRFKSGLKSSDSTILEYLIFLMENDNAYAWFAVCLGAVDTWLGRNSIQNRQTDQVFHDAYKIGQLMAGKRFTDHKGKLITITVDPNFLTKNWIKNKEHLITMPNFSRCSTQGNVTIPSYVKQIIRDALRYNHEIEELRSYASPKIKTFKRDAEDSLKYSTVALLNFFVGSGLALLEGQEQKQEALKNQIHVAGQDMEEDYSLIRDTGRDFVLSCSKYFHKTPQILREIVLQNRGDLLDLYLYGMNHSAEFPPMKYTGKPSKEESHIIRLGWMFSRREQVIDFEQRAQKDAILAGDYPEVKTFINGIKQKYSKEIPPLLRKAILDDHIHLVDVFLNGYRSVLIPDYRIEDITLEELVANPHQIPPPFQGRKEEQLFKEGCDYAKNQAKQPQFHALPFSPEDREFWELLNRHPGPSDFFSRPSRPLLNSTSKGRDRDE